MLNATEQLHHIASLLDEAAKRLDAIAERDDSLADKINAITGQDMLETISKRLRDLAHERVQFPASFFHAAE